MDRPSLEQRSLLTKPRLASLLIATLAEGRATWMVSAISLTVTPSFPAAAHHLEQVEFAGR